MKSRTEPLVKEWEALVISHRMTEMSAKYLNILLEEKVPLLACMPENCQANKILTKLCNDLDGEFWPIETARENIEKKHDRLLKTGNPAEQAWIIHHNQVSSVSQLRASIDKYLPNPVKSYLLTRHFHILIMDENSQLIEIGKNLVRLS